MPYVVEKLEDDEALMEGVCKGSCSFLTMVCCCCCVGLGGPGVLIWYASTVKPSSPDAGGNGGTDALALLIGGCAVAFAAFLWFCTGLCAMVRCCGPPPPAVHGPFSKLDKERCKRRVQHILILVNPVSGKKTAMKLLKTVVVPRCLARGVAVTVVPTTHANHALEVARDYDLRTVDGLVVMGGDGTVHEVVNGMMQRKDDVKVPIGNLPAGSGNSLLKDFVAVSKMHTSLEVAVDVVLDGYAGCMDVAHVQYGPDLEKHTVYSVNTVGYSADQCLSAINIDGWRHCLGSLRYDVCALWGVLKARTTKLRVTIDDGKLLLPDASSIFINSTQYFGKGLRGAPNAVWDDGKVDIIALAPESRGAVLKIFNAIKAGGAHMDLVCNAQASQVKFEIEGVTSGLFMVDGQTMRFHGNAIEMNVIPSALEFFTPVH